LAYNPVFKQLVEDSNDKVLGMVAYGIYKTSKREWMLAVKADKGRDPSPKELADYAATWTPQLIDNAVDAAESALAEFASVAIDGARPEIVTEALKGSAVRNVLLSMLAALLYTVALIMVALVLKAAGIDLLSVIGTTT